MPEARLQRTRDAYRDEVVWGRTPSEIATRLLFGTFLPRRHCPLAGVCDSTTFRLDEDNQPWCAQCGCHWITGAAPDVDQGYGMGV